VQQPLHLALKRRRQPQPEDAHQRRALKVAKDLERVGRDGSRPVGGMPALRAQRAAADGRIGVALRLDRRAALQAAGELRAEAHRVEQRELEPAGDDRP
jgi:hypothetical protein